MTRLLRQFGVGLWLLSLLCCGTVGAAPDSTTTILSDSTLPLMDLSHDIAFDHGVNLEPPLVCTEYDSPKEVGALSTSDLVEVSGIIYSRHNVETLWMHNDSGDSARLFATNLAGDVQTILSILDVEAVDFEDMATSLCPGEQFQCLWVADIGDNAQKRDRVRIHLIREPALSMVGDSVEVKALSSFDLSYPNGPVNAEAFIVSEDGSSFWIFEKSDSTRRARVYKSPVDVHLFSPDKTHELEEIGGFDAPGFNIPKGYMITAADLSPNPLALVLRGYTGAWQYSLQSLDDLSRLDEINPHTVFLGPLAEPQGEAIAYNIEDRSIWSVSEDPTGDGYQPIHQTRCVE